MTPSSPRTRPGSPVTLQPLPPQTPADPEPAQQQAATLPADPAISTGPEHLQVQIHPDNWVGPNRAVALRCNGSPAPAFWITRAPFIEQIDYAGPADALDLSGVQGILNGLGMLIGRGDIANWPAVMTGMVGGHALRITMAWLDDSAGTPGATPSGQMADSVHQVRTKKRELIADTLNECLLPPLTDISWGYLAPFVDGPDESLPLVETAELLTMQLVETSELGSHVHVPLPDGEGGVKAIYLGVTGDGEASLVLFEAPPPPQLFMTLKPGETEARTHRHPNRISLLYRHPLEAGLLRDSVQPARHHLTAQPSPDELQALIGLSVMVSPNDDETPLPVTLLGVTHTVDADGGRALSLDLESNFDPRANPLGAWETAWHEEDITQVQEKETNAGVYNWALHLRLSDDAIDQCLVLRDPLTPMPPPKDAQPPESKADSQVDTPPVDLTTLAENAPLRINGVPVQFLQMAEPGELGAGDTRPALWVTTDAQTGTAPLNAQRSARVTAQGPERMVHLLVLKGAQIERDPTGAG